MPLAQQFLDRFAEKYHRPLTGIAPNAAEMLTECRWSGNIRELQNCIEKAVILSDGKALEGFGLDLSPAAGMAEINAGDTMENMEEKTIRAAMARYDGNISMVA